MNKFLKITIGSPGEPTLIPVSKIAGVKRISDNNIAVYLDSVSKQEANPDVLAFKITTSGVNDAGTKAQLTALANLIEEALTTSWTNPFMDITARLPHTPTNVTRVVLDWA